MLSEPGRGSATFQYAGHLLSPREGAGQGQVRRNGEALLGSGFRQPRSTISIQLGCVPIGYCWTGFSSPVPGSIACTVIAFDSMPTDSRNLPRGSILKPRGVFSVGHLPIAVSVP